MSKEEMREGFEAWHCEQYKTHGMTGAPTRDMHNGVRAEDYGSKKSQALWECWQETGGDVVKVEALKDAIERIELGKQAVAFLMLGDIFHGVDGPEVDDWDIQYDHKVCEVLAQSNPGAQIPLFTRSDAAEVDRLREELAKFDEGMRALACSLGAGGYNAETLTADQLVGKVQWGIDHLLDVHEKRLTAAEQRNAAIEEAITPFVDYAVNAGLCAEFSVRTSAGLYGVSRKDWSAIAALKPTESGASE